MCSSPLILTIFKVINILVAILKIALPIIIIITTSLDIGKASISGNPDGVMKEVGKIPYKFVAAALIFFLPIIVKALCTMAFTDIDYYNVDCLFNVTDEMIINAKTFSAKEAVDKLKEEPTYANYSLASRLVGQMPNGTEKDALKASLKTVKDQMDLNRKEETEARKKHAMEVMKQREASAASASSGNSGLEGSGSQSLTGSEQEILNFVQSRYDKLHASNGSYAHKCGKLVCDQLQYSGLIGDSDRVMNGYQQAAAIANGGQTATGKKVAGYSVTSQNAVRTFEAIINSNRGELENLVISFSPYSGGGLGQYGHVCLITKIKDGKVYLVDNTEFTKKNGAYAASVFTVEDFENKYFGSFGACYMAHIL